jgi:DNA repair exonuclease SbcCD ATPase subunit
MTYILNRPAPIVVILLSVILLSGCSGIFGSSPREQADEAISNANESISEHNKLFDQARSTYSDVKENIEAGDDPSKEMDNITSAKNDLQEARTHLQDAKGSLETVDDLDVDPAVKEYAVLLSQAMQDQLDAEAKEIEFYGILEKDPALENNREEALDLLSEVGDGYQKAEKTYTKAQNLADEHPKLIEDAPDQEDKASGIRPRASAREDLMPVA